ncbi:MAG: AMIN domain-containing protein, partial [Armatimonadota bacterium]
MRGTQKATRSRGPGPRDCRLTRGLWPRPELVALCVALFLGALTAELMPAAEQPLVERVKAAPSADGLTVTITTNAPEPPTFKTFTLRNPDRLVFEFRGFRWEPRFAARLSAGRAGVQRIRVAQYASDPPITRMVFDLSVAPDQVRYDTLSQPGVGDLQLNFLAPGAAPA